MPFCHGAILEVCPVFTGKISHVDIIAAISSWFVQRGYDKTDSG